MKTGLMALAVAVALLPPRSSTACAPTLCAGPFAVPADGREVPANATALYWNGPGTPELFDDFGNPLSTALTDAADVFRGRFVVLGEALHEGAFYRIRYSGSCGGIGSPDGGHEQRFRAGPPVTEPSSIGLEMRGDGGMQEVIALTSRGSCFYKIPATTAKLGIALPAEAIPWTSLARVATSVDGKPWASAYWGGFDPARAFQCGQGGSARAVDFFFARCGPHDAGADLADDNGLDPGPHHAEVVFEIPHGGTARGSIDFELACADAPGLDGGILVYPEGVDGGCFDQASDGPTPRPFARRSCGCGFGVTGTAATMALLSLLRRRRV